MNANELMLGNYFIGYSNYLQQWELASFGLLIDGVEVDEIIKGFVPITEKWLLDFGFIKYGILHDSYKLNPFIVELGILGNHYTFRKIMNEHESILLKEMKYVHELQNLYKGLKGYELQLVSPK